MNEDVINAAGQLQSGTEICFPFDRGKQEKRTLTEGFAVALTSMTGAWEGEQHGQEGTDENSHDCLVGS